MKLLFVTQVVDKESSVLGAYHGWLIELARHFESIEVICLYEGTHTLPSNVRVHSLGKEQGRRSAFVYALRFLRITWSLRKEYDAVFVHMNQEYILLAGVLWMLLGKRIFLWRNHYAGSFLTDSAAAFCTNVFCTSTYSYTARYKHTRLMPVGVDTEIFTPGSADRTPRSILFLARIAPSKRPDLLIDALALLKERDVPFVASFYGSALPKDEEYLTSLKERVRTLGLEDTVTFYEGVPNAASPAVYRTHELFVNCSESGMFDKTLFEAAASGCQVIAASKDFAKLPGARPAITDAGSLADALEEALTKTRSPEALEHLQGAIQAHSLAALGTRLSEAITAPKAL